MPDGPSAAELHHRLVALPLSAQEEIRAIEWQLRLLHRRAPDDPVAAVALLDAFVRGASLPEAILLADRLWGARGRLDEADALAFIDCLSALGSFERALRLAWEMPDGDLRRRAGRARMLAALGQGDMAAARAGCVAAGLEKPLFRLNTFDAALEVWSLVEHFPAHQSIVNAMTRGRQVGFEAHLTPADVGEGVEFAAHILVPAPAEERRRLEADIDAALARHYVGAGMNPGAYAPLVTALVLDPAARRAAEPGGDEDADRAAVRAAAREVFALAAGVALPEAERRLFLIRLRHGHDPVLRHLATGPLARLRSLANQADDADLPFPPALAAEALERAAEIRASLSQSGRQGG